MNYRTDRYGNEISILGYGCMRFTQTAGRINKEKAEKEIMAAYQAGVNMYIRAVKRFWERSWPGTRFGTKYILPPSSPII